MVPKVFPAAAALLALVAAVTPVSAARIERTISYSPQESNSIAGARQLIAEIRTTAEDLCGPKPIFASDDPVAYEACVSTSVRETIIRLNNPMVTTLYTGKGSPEEIARR